MERRDLIKGAITAMGAAAGIIPITTGERVEAQYPYQPTFTPPDIDEDAIAFWAEELIRFGQNIAKARIERTSNAISIPFAAQPLHVYMRTPKEIEEAGIQEPKLDGLRAAIAFGNPTYGGQFELQAVTDKLWDNWFPKKRWRLSDELTVRSQEQVDRGVQPLKDRIVTPRYTIDLAQLTNVGLGLFCVMPVSDMFVELHTKSECAWRYALEQDEPEDNTVTIPLGGLPMNLYRSPQSQTRKRDGKALVEVLQVLKPRVWAPRQAYMWEYMVYTEACGIIAPPELIVT